MATNFVFSDTKLTDLSHISVGDLLSMDQDLLDKFIARLKLSYVWLEGIQRLNNALENKGK